MDATHLVLLLDRSYSMDLVRDRVVAAVNLLFDEQRRAPGAVRLTLAQFDTCFDITHDGVDLATVPPLSMTDYRPYGSTALFDCLAEMIDRTEASIGRLPAPERPANVVFVVVSDGIDSGSRVTPDEVRARIAAQPTWQFLFLGANMDAMLEGQRMGVSGVSFSVAGDGLRRAAETASAYVGLTRAGDRAAAERIAASPDVDAPDVTRAVLDFQRGLRRDGSP